MSPTRQVTGGSPQGTKLGNLLFCLTINDINQEPTLDVTPIPEHAFPGQYKLTNCSTPIRDLNSLFEPNPFGFWRKKNVINDTVLKPRLRREEYAESTTWEAGYIDDINVGETLDLKDGIHHITERKEERILQAVGCEDKFNLIRRNGKDVGLLINPKKTQLICFDSCRSADVCC